MDKKFFLPVIIVVVALVVALVIVYSGSSKVKGEITAEEATSKVVQFINENILQGQESASAIETFEESGVYSIKFDIQGEEVEWRVTKDGKMLFPQVINLEDFINEATDSSLNDVTIGNFEVTGDPLCTEGGKPIVYFFGSSECEHCLWEHPVMSEVANKFSGYISFHDNLDSTNDAEVFSQYNQEGFVPATLIGCKYYRVGSGENIGREENIRSLTALICNLTNNQPAEVCSGVEELIDII